jgi:hypothetical protein
MNRIDEITKRREAATKGPWAWISDDPVFLTLGKKGNEQERHVLSAWRCQSCIKNDSNCLWPSKEDADFIAHARQDIPYLLSELETAVNLSQKLFAHDGGLQIELSQLKTELEQVRREKDAAVDMINRIEKDVTLITVKPGTDVWHRICIMLQAIENWRGLSGNTGELKANVCDGCKHKGKYENEREYGYPSPCTRCKRICIDNYSQTLEGK